MKNIQLIVMCGIVASGKSTWAREYAERNEMLYLSSDEMRERLFGDETTQEHNPEVFLEMHRITDNALSVGQSVVYDACNLSAKRRANFVKSIKQKYPYVICVCVIMNTPIDECYTRNSERSRVVPLHVIGRQLKQFTMPSPWEGWDNIQIVDAEGLDYEQQYEATIGIMQAFGDQKNPHHKLTLYDHCEKCYSNALTLFPNRPRGLYLACRLHDSGKAYTQTIDDDGVAHYFGHANVSAYLAMNCGVDPYWIAVINYHMTCFHKQEGRVWKERLGKKMWKDIKRLHECDINAQE